MPIIEGSARGIRRTVQGTYSFAAQGGAVGDITLLGDTIPSGAVILDAVVKVTTAPTSGGAATVAIKVESAADIQSAAAISGAPWSTAGAKRTTFVSTTAPITTTAARNIVATVATAALTAGVFSVAVTYMEFG